MSYFITISNGLLTREHREKMGSSVWEFMWILDKMTSCDENGVGKVLGGKPIKASEIMKDIGSCRRVVSKNLSLLEKQEYISTKRTPYGLIITVYTAKKIFQKKKESTERCNEKVHHKKEMLRNSPSIEMLRKVPNKEDNTAIDNTIDTATPSVALKNTIEKKVINETLYLFKGINPNYERLFGNKTQRGSMERLIKKYGNDNISAVITEWLPKTNKTPFYPRIYTPYDLEMKMGSLRDAIEQQKNKKSNSLKDRIATI